MRNAEAYVVSAVNSVLKQDFSDLEVIIADDGSTDGSRAKLATIKDPRLRVIAGPCRGVAAASNAALAQATGAIVMHCDADDLYPPGRIGRQVELLARLPKYGAVCASFSSIDRAGKPLADFRKPGQGAADITDELLRGVTRTHLCTFAIRRPVLLRLQGKREYFETAEDIDLQLRLAESARIWFEPENEYAYRIHGSSLTHQQASNRRVFFESYARELRAQRAVVGARDDIERGEPRQPPLEDSPAIDAVEQAQGFLLGEAWRAHRDGARAAALRLGLRALVANPGGAVGWRNLAALAFKPRQS